MQVFVIVFNVVVLMCCLLFMEGTLCQCVFVLCVCVCVVVCIYVVVLV